MLTKEFQQFIDEQDGHLSHRYEEQYGKHKILARTVKLSEEAGEVSDAVLAYIGNQRKEKLDANNGEELGKELADVIIVAHLIAKTADIDLEKSLEEKMKKVLNRRNKD